jgi:hypothetical protein
MDAAVVATLFAAFDESVATRDRRQKRILKQLKAIRANTAKAQWSEARQVAHRMTQASLPPRLGTAYVMDAPLEAIGQVRSSMRR